MQNQRCFSVKIPAKICPIDVKNICTYHTAYYILRRFCSVQIQKEYFTSGRQIILFMLKGNIFHTAYFGLNYNRQLISFCYKEVDCGIYMLAQISHLRVDDYNIILFLPFLQSLFEIIQRNPFHPQKPKLSFSWRLQISFQNFFRNLPRDRCLR